MNASLDMKAKNEAVIRSFFDENAERYHAFYQLSSKLHAQRIEAACEDLSFDRKSVLDIAAGTGALYNYIQKNGGCRSYQAIDLSEQMLSKSNIPQSNQFVGNYKQFNSSKTYDLIFALGLTNYLDRVDNKHLRDFIMASLSDKGMAIISFTNRDAMSNKIKSFLIGLMPSIKNSTLLSGLSNTFFTSFEVSKLWPNISKWCFFNHAFNRSYHRTDSPVKKYFYSDFLIVINK